MCDIENKIESCFFEMPPERDPNLSSIGEFFKLFKEYKEVNNGRSSKYEDEFYNRLPFIMEAYGNRLHPAVERSMYTYLLKEIQKVPFSEIGRNKIEGYVQECIENIVL